PPCCPASAQETRVAGRRRRSAETARDCASREYATHATALLKLTRDAAARQYAHREVFPAKAQVNDRAVVRRAPGSCIMKNSIIVAAVSSRHDSRSGAFQSAVYFGWRLKTATPWIGAAWSPAEDYP